MQYLAKNQITASVIKIPSKKPIPRSIMEENENHPQNGYPLFPSLWNKMLKLKFFHKVKQILIFNKK